MAVTLMLFVRLPKAPTSARVKQALREMENTAKVMCLLSVELFDSHSYVWLPKSSECHSGITEFGCLGTDLAFGWVI